ncbi:hypothetical protein C8J35_11439 [Rhizobium sp. PP-F2F-G38]|uniref:hypothetical protein n=1 Tax=Rhizobium sp. PP-CC-3G-465 TaxID=2135648 RepID=UPI000D9B6FE9|nr:hypothetical protein C8J37_11535 [Rhizobium sp. PP-WC-1G-195]PYE39122.1 hypothetical protein DFI02_13212 [Rhizobium sp. PP-F2F-G20b]PYE93317.1 hypothetical protein C8J35_11439 [Rhizobium sp. PP-F2F-G38]TCL89426.1 hypothetical protein C8J38_11341 [Rhizobium sp. PP-WC-2G-219]TCQ02556.1 hypothetical protein C8J34_11727 [Rhizobium sp. PP-F2F-G36]TCQ17227.1 hypothetical protein C8J33_11324 [Rhizobium sp. PP-CC-3G-465]
MNILTAIIMAICVIVTDLVLTEFEADFIVRAVSVGAAAFVGHTLANCLQRRLSRPSKQDPDEGEQGP